MSADMTGPKEPNSAVLYGVHLTTSAYTAVFAEYLPPWEEAAHKNNQFELFRSLNTSSF